MLPALPTLPVLILSAIPTSPLDFSSRHSLTVEPAVAVSTGLELGTMGTWTFNSHSQAPKLYQVIETKGMIFQSCADHPVSCFGTWKGAELEYWDFGC